MFRKVGRLLAFSVVVASAVIVIQGRASAQNNFPIPLPIPSFEGTPEEQRACRPDAQRFCKEHLSDTFLVLGCLKQNRQRISNACQAVLRSHGQ